MPVAYQIRPIEENLRRLLTSEIDRQRFDRAKRFVDETVRHAGDSETAHRMKGRWLKFLCSRGPVQNQVLLQYTNELREFASALGLPRAELPEFIGLSLLGGLWRTCSFDDLRKEPAELVARLTRVIGWDNFDRCRRDGKGLILLPVHGQFSRLHYQYLQYRGHEGLAVGLPSHALQKKGFRTKIEQQFLHARQMHAAKDSLMRGGLVFNLPDAFQNLDNSRAMEFFGRRRRLAAGFAELALVTQAHVVPLAYRFSPRGSFVLEFGAPFVVSGTELPHAARVDSLVGQFADFLRNEWRRYPWNIPWFHLRHYMELPAFDAGDESDMPAPSSAKSGGARTQFAR